MSPRADRLSEKIQTLSEVQLAEVERFVLSLQDWQHDRTLARTMAGGSEAAFNSIWDNDEDACYDSL